MCGTRVIKSLRDGRYVPIIANPVKYSMMEYRQNGNKNLPFPGSRAKALRVSSV